jgi:hypothetical protein
LNKIPTSVKIQTTSTQAHKREEARDGTIFSRGKGSGSKLFLSLKNLFSRTDKSSASSTVAKAVPQATIEPIKTPQTKKVRSAYENRKIEMPMPSNSTEISNKNAEKKSNQLQNPTDKEPEQLESEKYVKDSFNNKLKSVLNEVFPDSNLYVKNFINAANAVMTEQMTDPSKLLDKENIKEGVKSKLNAQLGDSIEADTMDAIIDAVSISFDFAEVQEVRRVNELASQKNRLEEI